jgi:TPR repeat protein
MAATQPLPRPHQTAAAASDEEIAALVAGGRQLMLAGDIPNARLLLQQAAEAGNATAALELGATYDPTILQQKTQIGGTTIASVPAKADMADIRMARLWYEKARDLGSTEAAVRLERLRGKPAPSR